MNKITGAITKESLRECLKNPSEIPELLYPDGGERLGYTCTFLKEVNRDISDEIFSDLNTFDGFFETNGFGNGIYSIERSKTIEEDILNIQHAMFGKNYESDDRIYNRDYEDAIEEQIKNGKLEKFTQIDTRMGTRMGTQLTFPFFGALKMVYITSTRQIFQYDLNIQSKLIMDYIIMWKFIFAWWIGNVGDSNMFPEFENETPLKVNIPSNTKKETKLNEYLSKGRNVYSKENEFPPQILLEISYDDLTADSKNLMKRVHMKHILKYFLQMDTKYYGRCCMTYPLAIYHNGFTCNFESLVNGYRGILWSYFNGLVASKQGRRDIINRSKSRLSEIKEYGIRHIISRSFHNSLTRDVAREKGDLIGYEKRKLDTEFRDICTINDSMFMLATLSSFFNCPYTAMFALSWIILRFSFANYYGYSVDDFMTLKENDPRNKSAFSLNLSSDLIDGYLLPTWPFVNDLDRLEETMAHGKQTVLVSKIFSDEFSKIVLQQSEGRSHLYVAFINQVEYSLTNRTKIITYPRCMYILDHFGNKTIAPYIIDDEYEIKSSITHENDLSPPIVSYRSLFKGGDKSEIYIIVLFFTFLFIVIVALIVMYVYKTDKGIGLLSK